MKIAVVGSSHAGHEVIQTYLKNQSDAELHLYEKGDSASFMGWGSQSYLEGISKTLDSLHYANADSYTCQGVHVHLNSDVVDINPEGKTITVETPDGQHQDSYDKLFISPGSAPNVLNIPGLNYDHIYFTPGRDWTGAIKQRMEEAKKVVVIGGGYIGIEFGEAISLANIDTTIVEFGETIIPTYLDKEFTETLTSHAIDSGLKIKTSEAVQQILGDEDGNVRGVVTNKGEYEADTVIFAVGMHPATDWLDGVVDLNPDGSVVVNDYMQTSDENIYAAGDATKLPYGPTGEKIRIGLATNARRGGAIAAKNMIEGNKYKAPTINGTSGLRVFDYYFASTGIKDINLNLIQEEVESKYVEEPLLPSFMGNGEKPVGTLRMKIHYVKDSHRIVGAQFMAKDDVVGPLANSMSIALTAGWTLEQLATADFFFQPEYNRPWNYLNVLAMQALGDDYTFGSDTLLF